MNKTSITLFVLLLLAVIGANNFVMWSTFIVFLLFAWYFKQQYNRIGCLGAIIIFTIFGFISSSYDDFVKKSEISKIEKIFGPFKTKFAQLQITQACVEFAKIKAKEKDDEYNHSKDLREARWIHWSTEVVANPEEVTYDNASTTSSKIMWYWSISFISHYDYLKDNIKRETVDGMKIAKDSNDGSLIFIKDKYVITKNLGMIREPKQIISTWTFYGDFDRGQSTGGFGGVETADDKKQDKIDDDLHIFLRNKKLIK